MQDVFDTRFQLMGKLTQGHHTRHPCIALEAVQQSGDGMRLRITRRITTPQAQLNSQFAQLILGFFKEDR